MLLKRRIKDIALREKLFDAFDRQVPSDDFPDLRAIVLRVERFLIMRSSGDHPQPSEPLQIGDVRLFKRLWVGEHHIHRFREAQKIQFKFGPDVIGLQERQAQRFVSAIDRLEQAHGGAVAAFEKLDFFGERTERIRYAVLFREQVQGVADASVVAPIVDDKSIGFAFSRAVHARDGLQKRVLAQRSVKIEHLFNRRVEAREKHIADDQYLQRIVRLLETGDAIIPLALR